MTCQQDGCEAEATYRVYWPGQTTDQCETHARKVQALGEAMGIQVSVRDISVEPT